jgi:hypothetical protein
MNLDKQKIAEAKEWLEQIDKKNRSKICPKDKQLSKY